MEWLELAFVIAVAYLLGAIPSGLIAGMALGKSPTEYGSGKIGATNTMNTLGRGPAIVVALFDVLKGVIAVLLPRLLPWPDSTLMEIAMACTGIAAIIGHNVSVWVRLLTGKWGGGRGILTAVGAMLVVRPLVIVAAVIAGAITLLLTRYVAIATFAGIAGAFIVAVWLAASGQITLPLFAGCIAWGLLVVIGFHDNIGRLMSGTETRLGG